MKIVGAVLSGLSYIDGLRDTVTLKPEAEAQAFLEHLAKHGFVVRPRNGAERVRLKPQALDRRNVTGPELRAMRLTAGLSRSVLASRAGVSADAIGSWETGRCSPHAAKLAAVLDVLAEVRATSSISTNTKTLQL